MDDLHRSLLELQELDQEIESAEKRVTAFEPRLSTVEEPVTALQRDVEALRRRTQELEQEARRLERAADDKRDRLRRYEEHLERARNAREEAAARTEIDLVRKAIDADETEAAEMLEQHTRSALRLDQLETRLEEARAEVEPRRQEIVAERDEAAGDLAVLRDRRENLAVRVPANHLRMYERIRSGRTRVALAPMTEDGACSNCYNTLPIQEQSEIRRGGTLHRCEACGVILYAAE